MSQCKSKQCKQNAATMYKSDKRVLCWKVSLCSMHYILQMYVCIPVINVIIVWIVQFVRGGVSLTLAGLT